jgi:hypothetical protein
MTGIILPHADPPRGIPVQGGDGHSRCPEDGCIEVDRRFKAGGTDTRGETYLDWEIYHADRALGGCGANWAADTKQGAERNRALGREPRWLNHSAATERTIHPSPVSDAYRDNYSRIFGHD